MKIRRLGQHEEEIFIAAGEEVLLWDDGTAGRQKIEAAPGAILSYLAIFDPAESSPDETYRELIAGSGSTVNIRQAYFGNRDYRAHFVSRLDAEVRLNQRALFFAAAGQNLHLEDQHEFLAAGSQAVFRSDGLVAARGRAECYSEIALRPAAQETKTHIDLRLHLLGAEAKGTVLPSLLIAANRVQAGHAASTFTFSPEDLFYLRSRGLNEAQAAELAVLSAAESFLADLPQIEAQDIIRTAVKTRLSQTKI